MATRFKTSASAWTTWDVAPTTADHGIVGSAANPTSAFSYTTTLSLGSLEITSDYTPASASVTQTGGVNTIIRSGTGSTYSISLAANKTFSLALGFILQDNVTTSHSVYVGANSTLTAPIAPDAGGSGVSGYTKFGPGTLFSNDGTFNPSRLGFLSINEGTVSISNTNARTTPLGSGVLTLNGGTLEFQNTRTISNSQVRVDAASVIKANAGTGTITGALTGSAALTINAPSSIINLTTSTGSTYNGTATISAGTFRLSAAQTYGFAAIVSGTLQLNAALTFNGTTTLNSGSTLSLANASAIHNGTLSGAGSVTATAGCQINGDVSSLTGPISGSFTCASGANRTYPGLFSSGGFTRVGVGFFTFTNTGTHSGGYIASVALGTVEVRGNMTGTTAGTVAATLVLNGSSAAIANNLTVSGVLRVTSGTPTISGVITLNGGTFQLAGGATASVALANTSNTTAAISVSDATSCSYGGSLTLAGTTGAVSISVATGGMLTLSQPPSTYSILGISTRPITKSGAGTLKITSRGITAGGLTVSQGKLHLSNSTDLLNIGGGLTMNNGTTLDLSLTGASYLFNALTLNAGSTVRFGVAA